LQSLYIEFGQRERIGFGKAEAVGEEVDKKRQLKGGGAGEVIYHRA